MCDKTIADIEFYNRTVEEEMGNYKFIIDKMKNQLKAVHGHICEIV